MKLTTFKVSIAKYFRINVFFFSLINMKHLFYRSRENSFRFGKFMQQIAYVVVYIILLDEYVVFTKFIYLQLTSQRPLRTPESISCIFFNFKELGRRTLTEQFFECPHNFWRTWLPYMGRAKQFQCSLVFSGFK